MRSLLSELQPVGTRMLQSSWRKGQIPSSQTGMVTRRSPRLPCLGRQWCWASCCEPGRTQTSRQRTARTPLHRAAFHGWMPALKLLLENGADPSKADSDGKTPVEVSKKVAVQELFASFSDEQIQEAIRAQKEKMAQRPRYDDETSASKPAQAPEVAEVPKKTRTPKTIYYKDKAGNNQADTGSTDQGATEDQKQFLELHSTLDIIAQPDGYASRSGNVGGYKNDVSGAGRKPNCRNLRGPLCKRGGRGEPRAQGRAQGRSLVCRTWTTSTCRWRCRPSKPQR